MKKVMYIVINEDIKMSKGKIAAHTASTTFDYLKSMYEKLENKNCSWIEFVKEFKEQGDTIIVLKASEKDLIKWEGEGFVSVRDTGKTELTAGTITTVNLGIYDKSEGIPKWIQRLRLL